MKYETKHDITKGCFHEGRRGERGINEYAGNGKRKNGNETENWK